MSLTYAKTSGTLQCLGGAVNLNDIIETVASGAGVSSVEGLTGAITHSCENGTYATVGNDIQLVITFPIDSINNITGAPVIEASANSTIEVQTNDPKIEVGLNPNGFGIYTEATGGSTTATITSSLCVSTSVIQITYIHTGAGGGSQYIKNIVAGTGSFTITCNTAIDLGDTINWLVLNP